MRFDVERQQPVRNEQGFCIECDADEPGEVIGKILQRSVEARPAVRGLCDAKPRPTSKILRDVFEKGDIWFRTGDLMRKDENGYFYFVDRIGDTFRWKGENVSTTEVEEAIGQLRRRAWRPMSTASKCRDATAAPAWPRSSRKDNLNLAGLRDHLARHLPDYARPVFLRIARSHTTSPRPSSRRRSTS